MGAGREGNGAEGFHEVEEGEGGAHEKNGTGLSDGVEEGSEVEFGILEEEV